MTEILIMSWTASISMNSSDASVRKVLSESHLKGLGDVNGVVEDEEDDKFQGTPFPIPNLIWMEASTQWSSWRRRRQISRHTISESHLKGDVNRVLEEEEGGINWPRDLWTASYLRQRPKYFTWIMELQMKASWKTKAMCCLKNGSMDHKAWMIIARKVNGRRALFVRK